MKITSYKVVCKIAGLEFVETVTKSRDLAKDEYYAIMVTELFDIDSPYVRGLDKDTNDYLVGVEKTGDTPYISKRFNARSDKSRGTTIIVKTSTTENFRVL